MEEIFDKKSDFYNFFQNNSLDFFLAVLDKIGLIFGLKSLHYQITMRLPKAAEKKLNLIIEQWKTTA